MAVGTPVIASRVGNLAEIVDDGVNGPARRGGRRCRPGRRADRSRGHPVGDHRRLAPRTAAARGRWTTSRATTLRCTRHDTRRRRRPVTVVTSGHLSTCPRMLKSADALAAAGYDVRVVATRHEPWAVETDRDVRSRRAWPVDVVDYRRGESGATYWRSGARYRAARARPRRFGPDRAPLGRRRPRVRPRPLGAGPRGECRAVRSHLRRHDRCAGRSRRGRAPAVGRRTRSISRTSTAARRAAPDARVRRRAGARASKRRSLRGAAFLTTSSEAIAAAYQRAVRRRRRRHPQHVPAAVAAAGLRRAPIRTCCGSIGSARRSARPRARGRRAGARPRRRRRRELALRGRPQHGYLEALHALAARARAAAVASSTIRRRRPTRWSICARGYDVGLALEQHGRRATASCA